MFVFLASLMGDAPPLESLNLVHKAMVYKTYLIRLRKGLMILCSKWDVNSHLLCDHHLCDPSPLHPTPQLSTVLLLEIAQQAAEENTECFLNALHRKEVGCSQTALTSRCHYTPPSPPSFPSWETHLTHILCEDHHFIWLIWQNNKQTNACKAELKMARRWPSAHFRSTRKHTRLHPSHSTCNVQTCQIPSLTSRLYDI